MKANKKNKRKREQRQTNNSEDSDAPAPRPQRVTKNAPVSVRTQIKYAKMRKSMAKAPKGKVVHNKYRRAKTYDYEDIVEPEDLSHIYMPEISPSLMVDGYNIMFYWSKCCMMADNGDLEGARQLLVEELDTLSAMRGWTVTVVFDAYKRKGGQRRKYVTPNNIEVVFTSNGESADMYVERLTMELKDSGCPNVMVATGDKLMQSLVLGAGAEVFSPDRIIEEIEVCHQEAVSYTDMYMRRKESMIEKSEMQDLLDRVRSAEDKAKRRGAGRGGGGRGGRGNNGPTYNIEDDL
eukprot:g12300.t1